MSQKEYDMETFLLSAGFAQEEILDAVDELNAYRTIPGTTLKKYLNRVLATIEEDHRPAFLRGIVVGTALHKHLESDQLDDYINAEVARRLKEILADLADEGLAPGS